MGIGALCARRCGRTEAQCRRRGVALLSGRPLNSWAGSRDRSGLWQRAPSSGSAPGSKPTWPRHSTCLARAGRRPSSATLPMSPQVAAPLCCTGRTPLQLRCGCRCRPARRIAYQADEADIGLSGASGCSEPRASSATDRDMMPVKVRARPREVSMSLAGGAWHATLIASTCLSARTCADALGSQADSKSEPAIAPATARIMHQLQRTARGPQRLYSRRLASRRRSSPSCRRLRA